MRLRVLAYLNLDLVAADAYGWLSERLSYWVCFWSGPRLGHTWMDHQCLHCSKPGPVYGG